MMKKGEVIGFSSLSGGVGKTTILLNIAKILAEKGKRTIVLELELLSPKYHKWFNFTPYKTIYELYIQNYKNDLSFEIMEKLIEQSTEKKDGIDFLVEIVPESIRELTIRDKEYKHKDFANFIRCLLSYLRRRYDMVLIDSPSTTNTELMNALLLADRIVYVCTPPIDNIENVTSLIAKIPAQVYPENIDIIMNKVPIKEEKERAKLRKRLEEKILYLVGNKRIREVTVVAFSEKFQQKNVEERTIFFKKENEQELYKTISEYSEKISNME